VSSREYATDHALLHRKRAEAEVARRQTARDDALLEAGVIPKSRAETSRSRATSLQAELESLESAVGDFHDEGNDATGFNLRAPMPGIVVSRHLQTSASIGAQEVALVIARDTRWRLEVDVPAAVATRLTPEARLAVGTIEIAVEGRGTTLDPATQTIKARGTLPADSGLLPGQRVIARLRQPPPSNSVQLPRSALTHTGRRGEVFVATSTQSGKTFRRVDVEVLAETEDGAVVTGAISAGEEVVVSGTSALKGMGGG
jgi:cobalt-zinc-cadmium efflux system membrane fusion protein